MTRERMVTRTALTTECEFNKKLWRDLFNYNKATLRSLLAEYGVTRTKSLTKYQLIVKLYGIMTETD